MDPVAKPLTLRCQVDSYRSGWLLLEFLCHRFRYHPEEIWQERIKDGSINVNGELPAAERRVLAGDEISYTIHLIEPPVDFHFSTVYEDDHLLVVSKSGNLPVHASGTYIRHTLIHHLRENVNSRLVLANRLDRETSGLVVLCKNREAARKMSGIFYSGAVRKEYYVLVYGRPATDRFVVDLPVGPPRKDDSRPRRRVDTSGAKAARTDFQVLRRFGGLALLKATPTTGRTHQIRVHLAESGHPILEDKLYGPETVSDPAAGLCRQALHARRLVFEHPVSHTLLNLKAPLPDDFKAVLLSLAGKSAR